jgi:hypothetical protein
MVLLRWVILQVILFAALVALWMMGPLAQVFASEARWFVSGVVLLAGVGLVLSALRRQDGAARRMTQPFQTRGECVNAMAKIDPPKGDDYVSYTLSCMERLSK